jgi:CHAT domain-containing protein
MEIAMNKDAANKTSQTYLDFWLEILQAILEGNDTPQGFYPILAANQDKLNEDFRILWRDWTTAIIDTENYPEPLIITDIISKFSSLIKEFPLGNRAQNLEISITGLEMTRKIYSREVFPLEWAITQHNLGNAYRDRIFGDETENIKQGLAFYHNALEVFTPEEFPEDWARTKHNLAMAYAKRIRGKKAYNQELAFTNYQDALEVYSREAFPRQWAMIQNNLVEISIKRSKNKAYNGEIAIKYCQSALQVFTREEFPLDWAKSQHNLAATYLFISKGERLDYLELALTHSQEALQVHIREKIPYEWAFTQRILGLIYKEKGEIKSATECWQLSLEIFTPALLPVECFGSGLLLGDTAFITENWTVAIQGYEKAIAAVEQSREWATNEAARQEIQLNAIDVYINMVQACINDGQIEKALETVERSKSRNLVELLANSELEPKNANDSLRKNLRRLRSTISSIRQLLAQADNNSTFNRDSFQGFRSSSETSSYNREYIAQQRELLQEYQRQLDEVFAQCQQLDPDFTLTQQVKPITLAEIRDLIDSHTAILEWYVGTDSFQMFIVTQSSLEVVQFEKAELDKLESWNQQYLEALFNNTKTWRKNLSEWLNSLSQILRLNEILNHPALANCDSLILVPHRYLHLFPLHALSVRHETWKRFNQETPHLQPPANPCLLDCFKKGVRYAPSCQLLQRVQQRQRPPADTRTLFAIQNPTEDLAYTDIEVEVIKQAFTPADILIKQQATKTALIDNLETIAQAHYVHFSCHGSFDFQTPLISSLILAGAIESTDSPTGTKSLRLRSGGQANPAKCLTLQDIFATLNLPNCRLITLSACETGLTDTTKQSDDCIGLATGFLYAGSQGVLSSLWSVDDFATAYLMIKCYENLATADMAVALNTAQIWLRDATQFKLLEWIGELKLDSESTQDIKGFLESYDADETPFESPFYWAAFCAIGK